MVYAAIMTQRLTLLRPDDWHLHLRDGALLQAVLPESVRHFARALIMPNLVPPVVTAAQAAAYRDRILAVLPICQLAARVLTVSDLRMACLVSH